MGSTVVRVLLLVAPGGLINFPESNLNVEIQPVRKIECVSTDRMRQQNLLVTLTDQGCWT